ncbi:MAG: hypothetical protein IT171_10365 [Acidobacteria bacterium]|nr:hypothetical protein [Acidobacteriota bacterium]
MPKYLVSGSVKFAWEAEIEAISEEEACEIAELEVLAGDHLDLGANDLGKTAVKRIDL